MAAPRRKWTLEDKRRLLEMYDRLPRMTKIKAADRLNVTPSLLCKLLRNRSLITRGDLQVHYNKTPRLEAALWLWIDECSRHGSPASDIMIHRKAIDLAARMGVTQFRASPTWYRGFKRRERVVRKRYHIYPDHTESSKPCNVIAPGPTATKVQHRQAGGEWPTLATRAAVSSAQTEAPQVKRELSEPTVISAEIHGCMQTIIVPSIYQMKEAMKTLATGLLYRGFSDFKLLHHFEKEVAGVVQRSMAQESQDSFVA
ncbi:major centromere autoantigen B-like [Hoplias malabaricus]|uniref:major centromere autoantigen B-like n=1 Tax=Hoplias malabaricus TaxID=27720 RepID=UPI0034633283